MSCFYNIGQSPCVDVKHIDVFAAIYDTLMPLIDNGRIVIDQIDQGRVLVFCTDEKATQMPSDVAEKLRNAYIDYFDGPYDVQTKNRAIEQEDHWQLRNRHLTA